jgi:hypothetical protein
MKAMAKHWWMVAATGACILGVSIGSRAADGVPTLSEISGTIVQVRNNVVLQYVPAEGAGNEETKPQNVLVNSKTTVTLDGKVTNLGALKAEMWVRFSAAEAEGVLTRVEAFRLAQDDKVRTQVGIMEIVSGGMLTVSKFGNRYPFELGAETKITLDGKAVGAKELRHGMITTVTYQKGVPLKVESITAEMDGAVHRCEGEFVSGTAEELVMHVWGAEGFDIKFKVEKGFKIMRGGKVAAMGDFKAGEKVVANYTDGVAADLTLVAQSGGGGRGGAVVPAAGGNGR